MGITKGDWVYNKSKNRIETEDRDEYDQPTIIIDLYGAMGGDDPSADAYAISFVPRMIKTLKMMLRLIEGEYLDESFDGEATILRDLLTKIEEVTEWKQ